MPGAGPPAIVIRFTCRRFIIARTGSRVGLSGGARHRMLLLSSSSKPGPVATRVGATAAR
jgi:hypothetical protein